MPTGQAPVCLLAPHPLPPPREGAGEAFAMADRKAFALRLDPALFAAIARLASADLRSVNSEIEYLLREALRARGVRVEAGKPEVDK